MNTKSKQEDPHAQNPHNVINQDQISDVMLQRLKTVKNWANFIFRVGHYYYVASSFWQHYIADFEQTVSS